MKTIYLVSCVKTKRNSAAPAHDLYTSDWFKKVRAYLEKQNASWFILSAKHGLVSSFDIIEPYEETLNNKRKQDRERWALEVWAKLQLIVEEGDHVVFLAGEKYRSGLIDRLRRLGAQVEVPMQGLRSGEQKRWLQQKAA